MSLALTAEALPLEVDAAGVVRVGRTRITLDTVIAAFKEGTTAEEIVQQYPTLSLADVYQVLGYYLRRTSEVEAYLDRRRGDSETIRQKNASCIDPQGVRDRLLSRRASQP